MSANGGLAQSRCASCGFHSGLAGFDGGPGAFFVGPVILFGSPTIPMGPCRVFHGRRTNGDGRPVDFHGRRNGFQWGPSALTQASQISMGGFLDLGARLVVFSEGALDFCSFFFCIS